MNTIISAIVVLFVAAVGVTPSPAATVLYNETYSVNQHTEEEDGLFIQISVDEKEYNINISTEGVSTVNPMECVYWDTRLVNPVKTQTRLDFTDDKIKQIHIETSSVNGSGIFIASLSVKMRNVSLRLVVWVEGSTITITNSVLQHSVLVVVASSLCVAGMIVVVAILCISCKVKGQCLTPKPRDVKCGRDDGLNRSFVFLLENEEPMHVEVVDEPE